ncbi:MAG: zf-HC2 domain-containing protein [Acidobacteriaceae bacterium]|nr:zf-HC2 domain-containing protein [Acidobacteriaceae bacterium]
MNCTELESILADYADGTLDAIQRRAVDAHAAQCASCREFMADVATALNALKSAPDVEPPPELITRIAFQAPRGRMRQPHENRGALRKMAARWLGPILQPRLVMGMAMTLLSFSMLERCTGVQIQHIQAADLNPVRVWNGLEDKTMRVRDRIVKSYENLRVVYEIETRVKELQAQEAAVDEQALRRSRATKQGAAGTAAHDAPGASSPARNEGKEK